MAERYKIEGEVGKGGEGFVYNAYDKVLKRQVALKRVLTKDRGTAEEVDRAADALVAEAQTLSALNHPNIVTVFDVGKDEDGGFVVMELIKGETLDEVVARGAFTEEDFYRFGRQTLEALMAAQEINVVHRDLKPGNVMMVWHPGGRFQAKILDFGLAKFSEVPSLQTLDFGDSVKGSIYFMAPEQFERTELDERTDLYAMGCVYYFALTGNYPFDGETATMVMVSHLQHQVVSLEKVRPDLPAELCQWVMWLINRDIETRPDNAEAALNRFPQNLPERQKVDIQNLPVSESRSGLTTGVQVVMPTHSAEAPTGMVMTKEDLKPLPTIEPFDEEQYDLDHPSEERKEKKGCSVMPLVVVLLVGVLGYFGWPMIKQQLGGGEEPSPEVGSDLMVEDSQIQRLNKLVSERNPQGTAADVEMVLSVLTSKGVNAAQKKQAQAVLESLQGDGVDEALLAKLKSPSVSLERLYLSRALAGRAAEAEAVSVLVSLLSAGKGGEQDLQMVNALKPLVSVENVQPVLDGLNKNCSPVVRSGMEQVAASAFRRVPATRENLEPLLEGLEKATGKARASRWRILGLRGGDVVVKKLEQVFLREKHDEAYLLDALEALKVIPTPKVVNLLNSIYSMTHDAEIKQVAADALAHAVTMPSNDRMDVRSFWWQLALKVATDPDDLQRVFDSIADYPDAKTLSFLNGVGNSRTFGAYTKAAIEKIQQLEQTVPILESGQLMEIDSKTLRAQGAVWDADKKAITDWTDSAAWFVWHFKLKEAGVYQLSVLQAYEGQDESRFEFIIGVASLTGQAVDTGAWTEYQSNGVATMVKLEEGKTYTLFLKAGEVVQPQMMSFKGLRLQKQ
ncbi:MAG: serine/threonine-protein kinase [Verrucomicrobiota bacterium]